MLTFDDDLGNPEGYRAPRSEKLTKPKLNGVRDVVLAYIGGLSRERRWMGAIRRITRWDMKNAIMEMDKGANALEGDKREDMSKKIILEIGKAEAVTVKQILKAVKGVAGSEALSQEGLIDVINALRVPNNIPTSALEPKQTFDGTGDRHGPSM